MKIRKAAEHELLELWGYESIHTASYNAKFFCDNIKSGNAEFWALLQTDKELHISAHLELKQISVVRD